MYNKAYTINYDLKAPNRDYEGLYEAIKASPKWWHYLESTWIIATDESVKQVSARLKPHIDDNDRLLVIEVRENFQGWLPKKAWEWLHANVPNP